MAKLLVLHGPNLNLLGAREPDIYGHATLAEIDAELADQAAAAGHALESLQSNAEHVLLDRIHAARTDGTGFIVINPGAFTHTSVAILDALNAYDGLVFECHISNVHKRETFRHHSFVSGRADGVMAGFGTEGYELCVRRACSLLAK